MLQSHLQRVRDAYFLVMQGRAEDALVTLPQASQDEDPAAAAIRNTAVALLRQRDGKQHEADQLFDAIIESGVPLPGLVLLCGRHFKSRGNFRKAFECYGMLQYLMPHTMNEFINSLPPPERSRYALLTIPALLWGASGNLYPLQLTKEAVRESLGSRAAALVYAEIIGESQSEIKQLSLISLKDYATRFALAFEELNAPLSQNLVALSAHGGRPIPETCDFVGRPRSFFFAILSEATIVSKSNFYVCGGMAILDFQEDELMRVPANLDLDPIVAAVEGDTILSVAKRPCATPPHLDEAFALVGVHSRNFGHWLVEFLPKVWACVRRPGFDAIPIVIDAQMPPQHLEALRFFVGPDHPVVVLNPSDSLFVRRLWTCSALVYFPVGLKTGASYHSDVMGFDPTTLATLVRELADRVDAQCSDSRSRRVYLTRKHSLHRRLTNKDEVEAYLVAQGFEIFDFEDLPFARQAEIIRSADTIIGAHGSALFMTIIARPGTRIGMLSHEYLKTWEWFEQFCRELELPIHFLIGPTVAENPSYLFCSDYAIDLAQLAEFVVDLTEPRQ
ncbi:MAG: glycosyltransferase family 61 protein [Alphaproteobacteria bacterium]|nr:glycosyltransferase family 61 protein [Alphaproteobacteria bacterium]